ncbi:MAG: pyridoxamine 5'-phosphate oxidase family protein [Eubacteriaceae bacterium]|nr:pyridoxamine 5'-phosphate oxidase family protein [Eubacteriaceae bacterium]
MSNYEEGMRIIEETCGGGKDNVISLATVALQPGKAGGACPAVRDVDAYYEKGVFYISTNAKSNKMLEIAENNEVAFAVHFEGISGSGTAENLGWVLLPENAEIRSKMREAFADWYDAANNEQNKDVVILAVRIKKAKIFRDHGAVQIVFEMAEA